MGRPPCARRGRRLRGRRDPRPRRRRRRRQRALRLRRRRWSLRRRGGARLRHSPRVQLRPFLGVQRLRDQRHGREPRLRAPHQRRCCGCAAGGAGSRPRRCRRRGPRPRGAALPPRGRRQERQRHGRSRPTAHPLVDSAARCGRIASGVAPGQALTFSGVFAGTRSPEAASKTARWHGLTCGDFVEARQFFVRFLLHGGPDRGSNFVHLMVEPFRVENRVVVARRRRCSLVV